MQGVPSGRMPKTYCRSFEAILSPLSLLYHSPASTETSCSLRSLEATADSTGADSEALTTAMRAAKKIPRADEPLITVVKVHGGLA